MTGNCTKNGEAGPTTNNKPLNSHITHGELAKRSQRTINSYGFADTDSRGSGGQRGIPLTVQSASGMDLFSKRSLERYSLRSKPSSEIQPRSSSIK
eukprot:6476401-Amphidinium_carterae.3